MLSFRQKFEFANVENELVAVVAPTLRSPSLQENVRRECRYSVERMWRERRVRGER